MTWSECIDVLLAALPRAESWLGTSAIFIWRRLLRKQGWRKGWGDGWRRTRVDRLRQAYTNTGSTTAVWEVLHHPCKRLSASLTGLCFWRTPPPPASPPERVCKKHDLWRHSNWQRLSHPSAHIPHPRPLLSGLILKKSKHLFEQRGCKLKLQAREVSPNTRKTEESLWRAANNITNVLQ